MTAPAAHQVQPIDITRYSEAAIPTAFGTFNVVVYREAGTPHEHCAIVLGDITGKDNVLVRVHSECFTGEVLHSLKCDCRQQLDAALKCISEESAGAVLYLRQEGRGIGLGNKIRAYALQQEGADTVDANRMLGFADDLRQYHVATAMLEDLGVRSISLLTNNPEKVRALRADGVNISKRVPMRIDPNDFNREYLATKQARMGHLISVDPNDAIAADKPDLHAGGPKIGKPR
jgi:GTP cyclohydrolase II